MLEWLWLYSGSIETFFGRGYCPYRRPIAVDEAKLDIDIGRRVRERRRELRLTQEKLAGFLGVNRNTIGRIEMGQTLPSLKMLMRLAKALNVEPAELLARKKVFSVPDTPITGSTPEEIDKLLRLGDRETVARLLHDVDAEVRGLEEIVDLHTRARLYQATILQRWLQVTDDRRIPESNRLKTVSDVAKELGGRYKSLAGGEEASPEASTSEAQKNTA
jgi:transcriptional regulator with XRE-family HTH domain